MNSLDTTVLANRERVRPLREFIEHAVAAGRTTKRRIADAAHVQPALVHSILNGHKRFAGVSDELVIAIAGETNIHPFDVLYLGGRFPHFSATAPSWVLAAVPITNIVTQSDTPASNQH